DGCTGHLIHCVLSADVDGPMWAAHGDDLSEGRVLKQLWWIQVFNLHCDPLRRARAQEARDEQPRRQLPGHEREAYDGSASVGTENGQKGIAELMLEVA